MSLEAMSRLPVEVAHQMKIIQPTRTPSIMRMENILRPQDNTAYSSNGNNIIRFAFPRENVDFRKAYLKATITLTTTGGTYKRLPQGAWSVINRIRAVLGGVEDETQYYNRITSTNWTASSSMMV
jgi:hypothetical protein